MGSLSSDLTDWRDADAYADLLDLERAGFAWEWLRRQASYREEALEAIAKSSNGNDRAGKWRLHRFEDPRLEAPAARPVWTACGHHWVIRAAAERSFHDADSFELHRFERFARLVVSNETQHLLLTDGYHSIRLDVTGARLGSSPVRLSFELGGIRSLERPLLVLRRLRSFVPRGRFAASLHPPFQQARRLVTLLRAFDALEAGASQADIAAQILSNTLQRRRWRVQSPSLRSRAQRLAQGARRMADGQFWRLLE